jgi:hypothetical protein
MMIKYITLSIDDVLMAKSGITKAGVGNVIVGFCEFTKFGKEYEPKNEQELYLYQQLLNQLREAEIRQKNASINGKKRWEK